MAASLSTGFSQGQSQGSGQSTGTNQSASQSSPGLINDAMGLYNSMLDENMSRYSNVLGAYQSGQHNLTQQLPGVYQGYGDLSNKVMDTLGMGAALGQNGNWGVAAPAAQAIKAAGAKQAGGITQGLTNAGLGNTTAVSNAQNQNTFNTNQAYGGLGAQLANTVAGYQSDIGKSGLAARMQGLGMMTGLTQGALGPLGQQLQAPFNPTGQYSSSTGVGQNQSTNQNGSQQSSKNNSQSVSPSGGGGGSGSGSSGNLGFGLAPSGGGGGGSSGLSSSGPFGVMPGNPYGGLGGGVVAPSGGSTQQVGGGRQVASAGGHAPSFNSGSIDYNPFGMSMGMVQQGAVGYGSQSMGGGGGTDMYGNPIDPWGPNSQSAIDQANAEQAYYDQLSLQQEQEAAQQEWQAYQQQLADQAMWEQANWGQQYLHGQDTGDNPDIMNSGDYSGYGADFGDGYSPYEGGDFGKPWDYSMDGSYSNYTDETTSAQQQAQQSLQPSMNSGDYWNNGSAGYYYGY